MRGLYLLLMLFLVACTPTSLPPVVELKWHPQSNNQSIHRVKSGETLYAIAFRYDRDFRQLATFNHLRAPYSLRVGQIIHLNTSSNNYSRIKPNSILRYHKHPLKNSPIYSRKTSPPVSTFSGSWIWPVKGKVINYFLPDEGKKGIDIAGKKGDKIHASASGVVAYAGNGLSGYGNLIIIKHDGQYLTAYSNNLRNLVTEGQRIKAGQIIAEIGIVDRKFWGVHFEIRKLGQPINPLKYLR